MITWERGRDLLVVLGIALAVWQLYQAQKSLEVAGAALVVGPYFEKRANLVAAGTLTVDPRAESIGQFFAVAQIMCELVDTGVFSKEISDRIRNDAKDLRTNQTTEKLAAVALKRC